MIGPSSEQRKRPILAGGARDLSRLVLAAPECQREDRCQHMNIGLPRKRAIRGR